MATLYIANKNYSSWSLRPWVLMSELGIPFEETLVPFGQSSNWNAFRKFSPSGPFLAGSAFTAVDAFFAPVAFRVQTYGLVLPAPAAEYAQRLLAVPSMRRWYDAAIKESWRDEEHEQEVMRYGEVVEDLRTA